MNAKKIQVTATCKCDIFISNEKFEKLKTPTTDNTDCTKDIIQARLGKRNSAATFLTKHGKVMILKWILKSSY